MVALEPVTQGSHSLTDSLYQESHRGRRCVMSGQVSEGSACFLHFILNLKVLKQGVRAFNWPQAPSRLIMSLFQTILLGASQVVLVVKNPPANTGHISDAGLTPGSGRSPGGGRGNPLQYSLAWRILWTKEPGEL